MIFEEYMTPFILHIEEDHEDTDHHGEDDADNHHEATVHPHTCLQTHRFSHQHFIQLSWNNVISIIS